MKEYHLVNLEEPRHKSAISLHLLQFALIKKKVGKNKKLINIINKI